MGAKVYSLWLKPDPVWSAEFTAINVDLARRFAAPAFAPHLTLIGGAPFALADLNARLADIVRDISAFRAPIIDVVTGPQFFQSFYALFEAGGVILELKRRAMAAIGEDLAPFMPHVSLLYGDVEAEAKESARRDIAARLVGREVRFSSVAIAYSGVGVEIADWAIEAEAGLG